MSPSRRRILIIAGLIVLAAIGGVVAYYFYVQEMGQRAIRDVVTDLDQSDPNWKLADLERSRTDVPVEENSAPLILALHAKVPKAWWKEVEGENWRDLPPGEPLPADQSAILWAKVGKIDGLLPEARKLADRPRGRFRITFTPDVISTLIPHAQDVREVLDLLIHDVYVLVDRRDYDGAVVSCRAIVNLGRSLDNEAFLITQLVRGVCVNNAVAGLQHTLAAGTADAAKLEALQKALLKADEQDAVVVSLRGERAGMHQLYTNLQNGTVPLGVLRGLTRGGLGGGPSLLDRAEEVALATSVRASHVWLLKHLTAALEARRLPPQQQIAKMQKLHAEIPNAPVLAKVLTPAWIKCAEAFRRNQARLRCGAIGIALERYRLKHGQWPADLAALAPEFLKEVPADPYTGEPLKYRQTANGVVVFSVGPDGKRRGDFHDPPAADAVPLPGAAPGELQLYEFRLWDSELRGLPLAQRKK
jgi:hypothetical protein